MPSRRSSRPEPHWTEMSIADMAFKLASDFVDELEAHIMSSGLTWGNVARRSHILMRRLKKILDNPGLLTYPDMVQLARGAGAKLSVVLYDDGDLMNMKGPVNPMFFRQSWAVCGSPRNTEDMAEAARRMNGKKRRRA